MHTIDFAAKIVRVSRLFFFLLNSNIILSVRNCKKIESRKFYDAKRNSNEFWIVSFHLDIRFPKNFRFVRKSINSIFAKRYAYMHTQFLTVYFKFLKKLNFKKKKKETRARQNINKFLLQKIQSHQIKLSTFNDDGSNVNKKCKCCMLAQILVLFKFSTGIEFGVANATYGCYARRTHTQQ